MFKYQVKLWKRKKKLNSIILQVQVTPHPLYINSFNNRGSFYSKPKPCTQIYKNNMLASTLIVSPFQTKVETIIEWSSSWIWKKWQKHSPSWEEKIQHWKHSQGPKRLVTCFQLSSATRHRPDLPESDRQLELPRCPSWPDTQQLPANSTCLAWGGAKEIPGARVPGTPNKP